MNIDVHVICWNEEKILPFAIQYWKRYARHVYVYDNGSDDKTLEILAQYPDWITVKRFGTGGIDNHEYLEVKNNCWKGSDADWVVISDMDECLYSKDLFDEIEKLEKRGVNIIAPQWVECWGWKFPEYNEEKLGHELVEKPMKSMSVWHHKCVLLKPSEVKEINYSVGAHLCRPKGKTKMVYMGSRIFLVHMKFLSPEYVMERYKALQGRILASNGSNHSRHYFRTEEDIMSEFKTKLADDKDRIEI